MLRDTVTAGFAGFQHIFHRRRVFPSGAEVQVLRGQEKLVGTFREEASDVKSELLERI